MEAKDANIRGEVCSKAKQPRNGNKDKQTFKQQLLDERWRLRRKSAIARIGYKCQMCGCEGKLEVHHLYYVKGKKMWQYPYKALKVMCRKCHEEWHTYNRLEYREEIWSNLKEYQAPKKRKIYFVKKGGFSVQKEEPYVEEKKSHVATPMLTPIQKAKRNIKKRKRKGNLNLGFAPIPEWRKNKAE